MRRITMQIASLVLAASLFTGCSVTNTASDTPGASGGAISGSVAAEDGEIGQAGQKRSYRENSDNRYDISYDKGKDAWVFAQYRLDGTLVKKSKIEEYGDGDIEWVTDECLYFIAEDKNGDDVLWRIPIKKTEKGDQLLTDKKEKLLKAYSIDIDYVTDSYIIMEIDDDTGKLGGVYKYECKTGKLTELIQEKEEAEVLWGSEYPLMWRGELFYEGIDKLYSLDPEKGQVSSLYTFGESDGIDDYVLTGNGFYFLVANDLYLLDCTSKKIECAISEKKFLKAVRDHKIGKQQEISVDEMYLDQGRLYFFPTVYWIGKDNGSGEKTFYSKDGVFSISLSDMGEIRYEDKLMEYLDKKGTYEKDSGKSGFYAYFTSYFYGCADGKLLASYEHGKKRFVLYDLHTGEIKDMAEDKVPEKYEDLLY